MPVLGIVASQQVLTTPPPVMANLATWIDASDATSVTLSSGKVSQINDLSGNSRHMVQATSTNQPTYTSSFKNGLNVMQFGGAQWVRQSSNWTPASTSSVYIAVRANSGSQPLITGWSNYRMDLQLDDNTYHGTAFQVDGGNINSLVSSTIISNNNWYYITLIRKTGTAADSYLNTTLGSSNANNSFSALGSGTATLGTRSDGAVPFNGYIGEFLMYDGTHNSTQIAQMQSYLATKWGI